MIGAWIQAHPTLFAAIVWPLLTSLVTALFKPRTPVEYAALPVRVAAVLKVIASLGIDPVKLLEGLREIATGHPQATMIAVPNQPDTKPEIPQ